MVPLGAHHFLASIRNLSDNVPKWICICCQVWTAQSPSQNVCRGWNDRTVTVSRDSVLVLSSMVTTWNVSSPTRCLVLRGRQLCCSLVFPSEQLQETRCQRTDEHVLLPRSCQLPLQSRECGICIKNTHKPLLSRRGVNIPFSTCPACAWKKPCPLPPPTVHLSSGCFSVSPIILVLFAGGIKTTVPGVSAKFNSTYEKGRKRCSHPLVGMGGRREQPFSLWKQKFCGEVIHKNRTFTFPFKANSFLLTSKYLCLVRWNTRDKPFIGTVQQKHKMKHDSQAGLWGSALQLRI